MAEPVEKVIDVAADVAAEVAQQAEGAEKVIRSLNQVKVAYASLGVAIGATVGSLIAFNIAYRKAETKYSEIAAQEIAEMREHYNAKAIALDVTASKTDLSEIVKERGYSQPEVESTQPPMAVTPPSAVVDAAREAAEEEPMSEDDVVVKPPTPEPETRNIFRDNPPPADEWDWSAERAKRSPLAPYVIHVDEREEYAAYESMSLTYYEEDDVVCRDDDSVVDREDRERLLGEANLEKFGHGSGDATIVYIRNDELEIDFEVIRSPNSYAEEVHGFEPEIRHAHRRERVPLDDE